jgi:hypothetical protein
MHCVLNPCIILIYLQLFLLVDRSLSLYRLCRHMNPNSRLLWCPLLFSTFQLPHVPMREQGPSPLSPDRSHCIRPASTLSDLLLSYLCTHPQHPTSLLTRHVYLSIRIKAGDDSWHSPVYHEYPSCRTCRNPGPFHGPTDPMTWCLPVERRPAGAAG